MEYNTRENSKIEKKNNLIYKTIYLTQSSWIYKEIFRQYRAFKTIENKSDYLIQLKKINLIQNNNKSEVCFIFNDEGIDLYSLINSEVYDYREQSNLIKWILFQILKGLETLHSLNIIHRNINPKNIVISKTGGIKIIGFGQSINDIESKFVEDKIIGDINYMAPEILIRQNYNNKIDIFAVGVLMLELYYKKVNILNSNNDNPNDNYSKRFFKQIKFICDYFKIPFNLSFDDDDNKQKENFVSWVVNTNLDNCKFEQILNDIPDLGQSGLELLKRLLELNPKKRISAKEALKMEYFSEFQNLNKDEYSKKDKRKNNNENLSPFLKNLEKEFQRINKLEHNKKTDLFLKEIINITH